MFSDILSGIYSDILSSILSGILSGTYSDILSDIHSDILFGILSYLAFYFKMCILTSSGPGARDMAFGSRRPPLHPELAIWSLN